MDMPGETESRFKGQCKASAAKVRLDERSARNVGLGPNRHRKLVIVVVVSRKLTGDSFKVRTILVACRLALAATRRFLWQRMAGKSRHGFLEVQAVEMTDEIDDVAARRASATVPNLFFGIDRKSVHPAALRTRTAPLGAPRRKLDVARGNYVFDRGRTRFVDQDLRKRAHGRRASNRVACDMNSSMSRYWM
jgi:hypothetical protein